MIAVFVVISVVCAVALLSALTLFAAAMTLIGTDEAGEINECIGCRCEDDTYCDGCRLNPKYRIGNKYVGPKS